MAKKPAKKATRIKARPTPDPRSKSHTLVQGERVALLYTGATCPDCDGKVTQTSAFKARAGHVVEYWRCRCGAYGFERHGAE